MAEPRLASHIQVAAFVRLANQGGDFAAVVRKGDAQAGAIILIGLVRGKNPVIYERFPSAIGEAVWQPAAPDLHTDDATQDYLNRRVNRDPDLWIVELDVAEPERLDGLLAAGH